MKLKNPKYALVNDELHVLTDDWDELTFANADEAYEVLKVAAKACGFSGMARRSTGMFIDMYRPTDGIFLGTPKFIQKVQEVYTHYEDNPPKKVTQ